MWLVVLAVLVASVVVAVVAVVRLERWATTVGLERARQHLATSFGTDDVALDVPARPLLPALLRHPGTPAQVSARAVPIGDGRGRLRTLEAAAPDVRIEVRTRRLVTAEGTFRAVIAGDDLARSVRLPGVVARLELRRHGLRVWTVLGVPVDTRTELSGGALRVLPDPLQVRDLLALPGLGAFRRTLEVGGLRIELPQLPLGAVIDELEFGEGQVTASGRFPGLELELRST